MDLLQSLRERLAKVESDIAEGRARLAMLEAAKVGFRSAIEAEEALQGRPITVNVAVAARASVTAAASKKEIPESLAKYLDTKPSLRHAVLAILAQLGRTSLDTICDILQSHGLDRVNLRKQVRSSIWDDRERGTLLVSDEGKSYELSERDRNRVLARVQVG